MSDPGTRGQSTRRTQRGVALPVAHLLALAPLDVWVRIVVRSGGVAPRYWARLAGVLFTSLVGTVVSLPERVVLGAFFALSGRRAERFEHAPGVIVIAGYYRSGTTHAQNLIACSRMVITPRWDQAMLGAGFTLSWLLTGVLLVPFVRSRRPQDAVGFGPEWPAEDDFALASWGACSTLPGRLIFPKRRGHWERWNTLEGCTEREKRRWRRLTARFAWKVTRGTRDRVLVLKTPSHGAKLDELAKVFGDSMRVLWVQRDPELVVASNMRLHESLKNHALGDLDDPDTLRARVVEEYERVETLTGVHVASMGAGRASVVPHEALVADPVGTLSRALGGIGLELDGEDRARIGRYLAALGHEPRAAADPGILGTPGDGEAAALDRVRSMHTTSKMPERVEIEHERPIARIGRGVLAAMCAAVVFGGLWVGVVALVSVIAPGMKPRIDQLVWVLAAVTGLWAARGAGGTSRRLGVCVIVLTLVVYALVSFALTLINWNYAAGRPVGEWWEHNTKGALHGALAPSSVVFFVLGCMTAWRHCGEDGPRAPGR